MQITESPPDERWRPFSFRGIRPLVVFLVGFSALVLASNLLWNALFAVEPSLETAPIDLFNLWGVVSSTLQLALAALVLRYEGVRLRDIGLAPKLLIPALAAGGAVVVAVNVAVAGLGINAGHDLSVGFYPQYQSLFPGATTTMLAATGIHHYLFTGPAEELAFRGYVQNKLVSLLGEVTPWTRAGAIIVASASFGLLHLPIAIIGTDLALGGVAGAILLNTVSGAVFGTIYEFTRNLYLVMILHGFGDWWPVFVDAGGVAWPNWGVIIVVYVLLVITYRLWATRTATTSLGAPTAD